MPNEDSQVYADCGETKKTMKDYSLWIVPDGAFFELWRLVISDLSRRFGTPTFDPHVTLLSGIRASETGAKEKTEALASRLMPYAFEIESIGYEDYYFRSLYWKMRQTEKVMQANRLAQEVFAKNETYMPHLSMLYGDIPPDTKKEIIEQLPEPSEKSFTAASVSLYEIHPEIKDWRRVLVTKFKAVL
jgi:2'-5' RNA ligase